MLISSRELRSQFCWR